mmetsp:Transcript_8495/g.18274  ORF Transcript_8495/g.18274 Transcript_8495/m.18274 type:complete len:230 (+) Transcript_8495:217-906(+)
MARGAGGGASGTRACPGRQAGSGPRRGLAALQHGQQHLDPQHQRHARPRAREVGDVVDPDDAPGRRHRHLADEALPDEVAEDDGLDHGPPREVAHAQPRHYRDGEEAEDGSGRAKAHRGGGEEEEAGQIRAHPADQVRHQQSESTKLLFDQPTKNQHWEQVSTEMLNVGVAKRRRNQLIPCCMLMIQIQGAGRNVAILGKHEHQGIRQHQEVNHRPFISPVLPVSNVKV